MILATVDPSTTSTDENRVKKEAHRSWESYLEPWVIVDLFHRDSLCGIRLKTFLDEVLALWRDFWLVWNDIVCFLGSSRDLHHPLFF